MSEANRAPPAAIINICLSIGETRMAIKCINLVQVICDDCGDSIMLKTWQEAKHLGWAFPCAGAHQQCPPCFEKYKNKIFADAKLAKISDNCPIVY